MDALQLGQVKETPKPVTTIVTTLQSDRIQINPDGSIVVLEQTKNAGSSTSAKSTKSSWSGAPRRVPLPPRFVVVSNIGPNYRKIARTQSNHVIVVKDSNQSRVQVQMNQKLGKLIIVNCVDCQFQVLDSAVLTTKQCEMVNCTNCVITFDACDCSELYFYDCDRIRLQVTNEETMVEDFHMRWFNCKNCAVDIIQTTPGTDPNNVLMIPFDILRSMDCPSSEKSQITTKLFFPSSYPEKLPPNQKNADISVASVQLKIVEDPLGKKATERTKEHVLKEIEDGLSTNEVFDRLTTKNLGDLYEEELSEYVEPDHVLENHVKIVAEAIKSGKFVVFYTGAGVSTSASIPDYRGPEGAWTLRDKGGKRTRETKELSQALPTYTHYAITHLLSKGLAHYVISTNLDGLHRRSGTPQNSIVELHGNCYREVCGKCSREYLRSFDVLYTRFDRWSHITGRKCNCGGALKDTIAHFTENLAPGDWRNAVSNSRKCDVAVVLGTSMNVQPAASLPFKALSNKGGKMFIVNLQRTPYDNVATEKIYSKTDEFMSLLMKELSLTNFDNTYDHCKVLAKIEEAEELAAKTKKRNRFLVIVALVCVLIGIGLTRL